MLLIIASVDVILGNCISKNVKLYQALVFVFFIWYSKINLLDLRGVVNVLTYESSLIYIIV